MKALIGTAVLALMLAGCGGGEDATANGAAASAPSGPAIAAPNAGDWTETVAETPEGGFLMGNPDAPVKLVEYGSLTCGHCAQFTAEASEPLKNDFVKTGRVSWEFRPYLLFPTDPGISMLLRCQGAGPFFALTEQLYATQTTWAGRIQSLPAAQLQQLQALSPAQAPAALVRAGGIDQFFRERGMPQAKIDSCLADAGALERLAGITSKANEDGVTGTPSFFINGKLVADTASWGALRPKLEEALR